MAAPAKPNYVAVVSDISSCISCSKQNKQKYYIVNKMGLKGPSYEIATAFYSMSFQMVENHGAYLCINCKRLITRVMNMEKSAQKLTSRVKSSSQIFNLKVFNKRCIQQEDNGNGKRWRGNESVECRLEPEFARSMDEDTAQVPSSSTLSTSPVPTSSTMSAQVPTSSTMSTTIPTSSTMSTPVPTSSTMSTTIPTSSTMSTTIPTSSTMSTPVPSSSTMSTLVPSSSTMSTTLPTSSTMSTPVPSSSTMSTVVPSSSTMSTTLPTSSTISTTIPTSSTMSTPVTQSGTMSTPVTQFGTMSTPLVPLSSTMSVPVPTSCTMSTPVPSSSTMSTPVLTSCTISTPVPPSCTISTPVPTSCAMSTPVTTSSTMSTPVPTSSTMSTPVPSSSTMSTVVPSSSTISTTLPTSSTMSTTIPTSSTMSTPPVPLSSTMSTPVPTSCTMSTPVPTYCTMSTPVPTSRTMSTLVPKSCTMPTLVPKSCTRFTLVPQSCNRFALVPQSRTMSTPVSASCTMSTPVPTSCTVPTPVPTFCYMPMTQTCDKEVQCNIIHSQCTIQPTKLKTSCKRKEQITYLSSAAKNNLSPVVRSLTLGSFRKATRLLLGLDNETIKTECIKGVTDVVGRECSQMIQTNPELFKKNFEEDMINFDLDDITSCFKQNSSLLWNTLCTVATTKTKFQDHMKVTTAALILLNARSKFLCRFQSMVSIAMFNNKLQKEGHNILHKLGVTVNYNTLNDTLKKAKEKIDEASVETEDELNMEIEEPDLDHMVDHDYAPISDMQEAEPDASCTVDPDNKDNIHICHPEFSSDNLDNIKVGLDISLKSEPLHPVDTVSDEIWH